MKKIAIYAAIIIAVAYFVYSQAKSSGHQVVAPNLNNQVGSASNVTYKNGQYTGSVADAFYGNIQVQATISGGKIADVTFLQYPSDRSTSVAINSQAMPYLKQEAIAAQSANVDIISGATDTSGAFRQSLQSALMQAQS